MEHDRSRHATIEYHSGVSIDSAYVQSVLFFALLAACSIGPGDGSPMATNVVILVVVIRFSIPLCSVISRPIATKLFTHITDNILRQATVAEF